MRNGFSVLAGALLFAAGAIGAAIWLWFKRRQLVLAAATAAPERATAAATDQASAVPNAIPDQASAATNAAPELRPSGR
ncbi:hypothetical protein J3E61_005731 [Mycobacterium sp. OAE908]